MSNSRPPEPEIRDSRDARRFNAQRSLPAQFLTLQVSIQNLGGGGVQIEHSEPMKLGTRGTLRIDEAHAGETMTFPARVVWSHLSKNVDASGKFRYRTGLLLIDPSTAAIGALGRLIHSYGAPDSGSLDRKRQSLADRALNQTVLVSSPSITAEDLDTIRSARAYLQVHHDEAQKWYNRAKFSFANISGGDFAVPYRDEVLAIWEYTGRSLPLPIIVQALDTLR